MNKANHDRTADPEVRAAIQVLMKHGVNGYVLNDAIRHFETFGHFDPVDSGLEKVDGVLFEALERMGELGPLHEGVEDSNHHTYRWAKEKHNEGLVQVRSEYGNNLGLWGTDGFEVEDK